MVSRRHTWLSIVAICLGGNALLAGAASPWGADYFPNVPLTTSEGKSVRFFDDLIKDKIVAINFIYTTCPDTCPLETAQLVSVQNILGDRLGKDVFFYSITIDPAHDTAAVLEEYRQRFGAQWTFLTGKQEDITQIRRKLGLYIEEIQDGSNNHNVSMIIGNQATGRWMKRSPFENPYVLADQLGNWLSGWSSPPRGRSYANAPKLRNIPPGEQLFRTRCASCHSVTGNEPENALGPDLLGVVQQRDMNWLINWLRAPDQMLTNKDPIAMALYNEYDRLPMPNMRLNQQEAMDLLVYIDDETRRLTVSTLQPTGNPADVLKISNAWVREAHAEATSNAGYMTLINNGPAEVTLIKVESDGFGDIEVHEMVIVDGLMQMKRVADMKIPSNSMVQLSPGGKHLMMTEPQAHFSTGQKVDLTLTFRSGKTQSVSVEVASR
jgi:copper(I)-binding protein/cytochrome oxidase Cu insertion factor (SCO1/SenC/PrrC family)